MSFVDEEDILNLMEALFVALVKKVRPDVKIVQPFPHLSYAEAMRDYGTDKPDLRFDMKFQDLTEIFAKTEFAIFRNAIDTGGKVTGICAPGCADYSRKQLDELNKFVVSLGGGGVVTIALGGADDVKSVVAKFLSAEQIKEITKLFNAKAGDLLLILAGKPKQVDAILSELRLEMGRRLKLADPKVFSFACVRHFPLLRWDDEVGRWEAEHHPFTAPWEVDVKLLDSAPEKVRGKHYDIVCNGYEIGGGSVRIHQSELQRKIFRLAGYTDKEIDERFGHMLEAFQYGAPPHGGIAIGLDRVVMLLADEDTIREVIAFPKNQAAVDLTFDAPSSVSPQQIKELHLRLREEE
jgi:aspartyl-tRNA synthetase